MARANGLRIVSLDDEVGTVSNVAHPRLSTFARSVDSANLLHLKTVSGLC